MLIILDWDGTLIDSADKIVGCMRAAALDVGLPARAREDIRNIIGLGMAEALHSLYPEVDDERRERFRRRYSERFVEADRTPCHFFPGVMETLRGLRASGHRLAVATGKSRRGLDRVFGNLALEGFFHASRCADETRSKPHPLMLEQLCGELGCDAGEAVMVGDTEYDMEMAARIDMPRIGVSYGAHAPERLQRWAPAAIVDEFSALAALIDQQN